MGRLCMLLPELSTCDATFVKSGVRAAAHRERKQCEHATEKQHRLAANAVASVVAQNTHSACRACLRALVVGDEPTEHNDEATSAGVTARVSSPPASSPSQPTHLTWAGAPIFSGGLEDITCSAPTQMYGTQLGELRACFSVRHAVTNTGSGADADVFGNESQHARWHTRAVAMLKPYQCSQRNPTDIISDSPQEPAQSSEARATKPSSRSKADRKSKLKQRKADRMKQKPAA